MQQHPILSSAEAEISLEKKSQLVTVKQLAEVLNVGESTVKRTVEKLRPVLVADDCEILQNNQGGYLFNEKQATLIKQEIQKSHNLASRQIDEVSTETEIIEQYAAATKKLVFYLQQKKAELEQQVEILTPKAEFFDQVTDSKDAVDMSTTAKLLNFPKIGRTKLFEILRYENVLQGNNQPYQRFIDAGFFRVVESKYVTPAGETRITFKTIVYQKGIAYIRKLLIKKGYVDVQKLCNDPQILQETAGNYLDAMPSA